MNQVTGKSVFSSGWVTTAIPYVLFALPVILTCRMPFFWDTIQLGSRHAHFFYENNFSSLFLPNDMDSGHIPAFGMYLAFIWKLFGRSLAVSHLAMLPFVMGIVFFTRKLVDHFFQTRRNVLITCFLLADATILTQFTLVSPDIWLLLFFTMALVASTRPNHLLLSVALAGLTLTSMRGMMLVAAIFFAELVFILSGQDDIPAKRQKVRLVLKYILRSVPVYLPAIALAATYLGLHYLRNGWIGYHSGMPWAEHFGPVNLSGFLRNIVILTWRLADQGRILIWLAGAGIFLWMIMYKIRTNRTGKWLLTYTVVVLIVLSYPALAYKNLSGHRYLIPVFYLTALTVTYHLIMVIRGKKTIMLILSLLAAGLLTGNFWVWPDQVAKGWDAMLSYLPYQPLRQEMIRTLDERKIPFGEVGTHFPNNIPLKYIDLSEDTRSFGSVENGMDTFRYIFYSNIFNDFTDAELTKLRSEWAVVQTLRRGQVKVILYENPGRVTSE